MKRGLRSRLGACVFFCLLLFASRARADALVVTPDTSLWIAVSWSVPECVLDGRVCPDSPLTLNFGMNAFIVHELPDYVVGRLYVGDLEYGGDTQVSTASSLVTTSPSHGYLGGSIFLQFPEVPRRTRFEGGILLSASSGSLSWPDPYWDGPHAIGATLYDADGNFFADSHGDINFLDFVPVPEPTSLLLIGTGLLGFTIRRRRGQASEDPTGSNDGDLGAHQHR